MPSVVKPSPDAPRLTGTIRRAPFHYLHEACECVSSCETCREERDLCKCSYYGRGLSETRVHSQECEIHG